MSATTSARPRSMLPPRALLLTLLGQVPLILVNWPLHRAVFAVLAGAALIAVGVAVNIRAARLFEQGGVGVYPFSRTPRLVTRGPFAISRNPMYLGLVMIAAGLTVASGVLINIWLPLAFAVWLHYAYVLPEEQFLRGHFGAGFEEYARRVPRWVLIGKQSPIMNPK